VGLAPVLGGYLVCWFVGLFFCHAFFAVVRASGCPLVGVVLGLFSCGDGEQRVLVAAPRFALYVARNKHPLLAFWGDAYGGFECCLHSKAN